MNANFDLRDRIFAVAEANRRMVHTARKVGCSAKFAGSGGAIIGMYEDETPVSTSLSNHVHYWLYND